MTEDYGTEGPNLKQPESDLTGRVTRECELIHAAVLKMEQSRRLS